MSFKLKNAKAIIKPVHATISILFQEFPLYPYLLAGEMTEFLMFAVTKSAVSRWASRCSPRFARTG